MKSIAAVMLAVLLISSSCEKQEELPVLADAQGVITSMPYQWKTSLSEDGRLIYGTLSPTIQYDEHILFASQGEGKNGNKLSMLSIATGEIRWQWDDFFDIQKNFFDIRHLQQYENHLVFQEGRQFYHLDLANGTALQKEEREYVADRMGGLGETYFVAGNFLLNQEGLYEGAVFDGSVIEQTNELLISPDFTRSHAGAGQEVGIVGSVVPFEEEDGDILLIYDYSDPKEQGANTYIGLFNYSKKVSIYDKKPLALDIASYGSGVPIIYDNKIYCAPGRSIICLDLYTGEKIWEKRFNEGFTFSGFIIEEDRVFANCEDTYLYALDPETGQQLWKEKSSGTSSPISYLSGILYFVGGGDGLLHAVEAGSGKHLWRLHSPDLEENEGAWFKSDVRVVPPKESEKGKVLVSSYLSAFCYEAAR